MKITRIPFVVDSSWYSAEWSVPRAAGCHLMQVVDYMETELQIADPSRDALPPEALEWYRFGGFMTEHMLARHAIDVECARDPHGLQRPGAVMWCADCDDVVYGGAEITAEHCATHGHRGIHASPDAVMMRLDPLSDVGVAARIAGLIIGSGSGDDTWMVKEWKCTWKSQRRAGGDNDAEADREHLTTGIWRWPAQTKAYAYLMRTNAAVLDAFFVNGKYAPPVPSGDHFLMRFTDVELAGNWSSVVSYARKGGWI